MISDHTQTIAAVATATGGALNLIRISGPDALKITDTIFRGINGKSLISARGFSLHFGKIMCADQWIDEVLVSVFRAPHSYTGEDMAEISCHGSSYIARQIMALLNGAGARNASAGEFTMRAFMNGKMDLSQAEAVADLIASDNRASHATASRQMRGGYSEKLSNMHGKLLNIISLLELELDFSEEDVEFADRSQLRSLIEDMRGEIERLRGSFHQGNAIKTGIPVAIIGAPNVGKSTLLNRLLQEEKAIVSDIPGTTRDMIEDSVIINGLKFRFIDTAGIRDSSDCLESIGIERSKQAIQKADILLYLTDGEHRLASELLNNIDARIIVVLNKIDRLSQPESEAQTQQLRIDFPGSEVVCISAKHDVGLESLQDLIVRGYEFTDSILVTNQRHYEALNEAHKALMASENALNEGLSAELIVEEIRSVIRHLGEISGEITSNDVLGTIFSKFCIGK